MKWIVGRRIVKIKENRYEREEDFREEMMRVKENIDEIKI